VYNKIMNNQNKTIIYFVAGCFIIIALFGYVFFVDAKKPGPYDEFAQCITNSGAKFYGAYWCPHCQKQKAEFGKSAKLLPYIECDTLTKEQKDTARTQIQQAIADGRLKEDQDPATVGIATSSEACMINSIKSYPTWIFADGSRVSGEQSFAALAAKTGCVAPVVDDQPVTDQGAASQAQ
jgi:thiol-disulfide isomerase/thioredoxin